MNHKNHNVLIADNGLFIELAVTLSKSFGKTFYYSPWESAFPRSNQILIGKGIEGVERVDDIWSVLDQVDLWVFPDVYSGPLQVYLDKLGKRVWGSRKGEELELWRKQSKEYLDKLGISIGNYEVITGLDKLRNYLKEHDNQWVKVSRTRGDFESFHSDNYKLIEPRLDELEHNLGAKKSIMEFIVEDAIEDAVEIAYDGYSVDGQFPKSAMTGIEQKDKGYIGHFQEYDKMPDQVKQINTQISDTLKMYGYKNFISMEARITKDGTAHVIDPCFSSDTEILTNEGWKFFYELTGLESVATLNQNTKYIEYKKPTDYLRKRYKGKMIYLSNKEKTIECLVTPNHGIWRTNRDKKKIFVERADSLSDKGFIPRTGIWNSPDIPLFILPSYTRTWKSGKGIGVIKTKYCPPLPIPMDDWLAFLGIFLAEGSLHGGNWSVNISQKIYMDSIDKILSLLPFKYVKRKDGFVIHSVQLAHYLKQFGHCYEKYIPDYVKETSPRQMQIFLDAYLLGDGTIHKGNRLYFTTSKRIADSLQELIFKCGRIANIRIRNIIGTEMSVGGRKYTRKHNIYVIGELRKQVDYWFETKARKSRYIKEIDYDGWVYDVTVQNHIVYVRRNGKPFWSSNCMRCGSPPFELAQLMYSNLADILWSGAEGKCIDPVPAGKWGAELLIHSSWADKNWQAVQFPEEIRENVKFRNLTIIKGEYYVVPQAVGLPEIGAVVAVGDTMKEAIEKVKEYAKQIEGYYIDIFPDALDEAQEDLDKLKGYGIIL